MAAPMLISSCGPHLVALGVGRSLFLLPPVGGGPLAREAAWLDRLALRPWDTTLVEAHLARALPLGSGLDDAASADGTAGMVDVSADVSMAA